MHDPAPRVGRFDPVLDALRRLTGGSVQVWSVAGGRVRPLAGEMGAWCPPLGGHAGQTVQTAQGEAWLEPLPALADHWMQLGPDASDAATRPVRAKAAATVMAELLRADQEAGQVAAELATRYEEIDLLYTIAEVLGHTVRLEEAAQTIAREVADVVGARRASILVYDEASGALRIVGGRGLERFHPEPIPVDDPDSIAARVFREGRMLAFDSSSPGPYPGSGPERGYRGKSFLSLPIIYQPPGGDPRPIGVINLTDRVGSDAFTAGHKKLLAAIAHQVGAAIENARLVEGERRRVRLDTELQLARGIQAALLQPQTAHVRGADVGARTRSADEVGGDFYKLIGMRNAVGVLVGDVSSHGLSAALLMAHVIAAAGIIAQSAREPERALRRLFDVIRHELARTEMHVSIFYGIIDPRRGTLRYANAGHPQAFLVPPDGGPVRLPASAPPLGLGDLRLLKGEQMRWQSGRDLLCVFSDGFPETAGANGERFGEERVLSVVRRNAALSAPQIVDAVFAEVEAYATGPAADDRTMVLVRR